VFLPWILLVYVVVVRIICGIHVASLPSLLGDPTIKPRRLGLVSRDLGFSLITLLQPSLEILPLRQTVKKVQKLLRATQPCGYAGGQERSKAQYHARGWRDRSPLVA
jgi:hypothetical protein